MCLFLQEQIINQIPAQRKQTELLNKSKNNMGIAACVVTIGDQVSYLLVALTYDSESWIQLVLLGCFYINYLLCFMLCCAHKSHRNKLCRITKTFFYSIMMFFKVPQIPYQTFCCNQRPNLWAKKREIIQIIFDIIKSGVQIVVWILKLGLLDCIYCKIISIEAFFFGIISLFFSVYGLYRILKNEKMEKQIEMYRERDPNEQPSTDAIKT